MKKIHFYHTIIQLLILLLLAGPGFGQIEMQDCGLKCAHCKTEVVPPCCIGDEHRTVPTQDPDQKEHSVGGCGQDAFCRANGDVEEVIATSWRADQHSLQPEAILVSSADYSFQLVITQPYLPLLPQTAPLYQLNCSYLN